MAGFAAAACAQWSADPPSVTADTAGFPVDPLVVTTATSVLPAVVAVGSVAVMGPVRLPSSTVGDTCTYGGCGGEVARVRPCGGSGCRAATGPGSGLTGGPRPPNVPL